MRRLCFCFLLSILSIAMSTAIFPRFVQCINNNTSGELESVFNESIKINVAIFVPITILFLFYGDFILKLFFQRGKFHLTEYPGNLQRFDFLFNQHDVLCHI